MLSFMLIRLKSFGMILHNDLVNIIDLTPIAQGNYKHYAR